MERFLQSLRDVIAEAVIEASFEALPQGFPDFPFQVFAALLCGFVGSHFHLLRFM